MSEDVWLTCLTHALSTGTEEIMGLLLGDIEYSKDGSATALIWGTSPQSMSDVDNDHINWQNNTGDMMMSGHMNEGFVEVLAAQQSP